MFWRKDEPKNKQKKLSENSNGFRYYRFFKFNIITNIALLFVL